MSEPLQVRAEILKLARLLDVEAQELGFLEEVSSEDLRGFRESATDRLFDQGAKMLGRIGAARQMSEAGRRTMVAQQVFHEPGILRDIVQSAVAQGLWLDLVPLVEALPADVLPTLVKVIDNAEKPLAEGLLAAIGDSIDSAGIFARLPVPIQEAVRRGAERLSR